MSEWALASNSAINVREQENDGVFLVPLAAKSASPRKAFRIGRVAR